MKDKRLTFGTPENTCNDCDPAIPDTLYVTLSGLNIGTDYNRTHEITHSSGCTWDGGLNGNVTLTKHVPDPDNPHWDIRVDIPDCSTEYSLAGDAYDPCDPRCSGASAEAQDTCTENEDSTCNVSYEP